MFANAGFSRRHSNLQTAIDNQCSTLHGGVTQRPPVTPRVVRSGPRRSTAVSRSISRASSFRSAVRTEEHDDASTLEEESNVLDFQLEDTE